MADNNSTVQFKADISQLRAAMQQAQRQVRLASSEFQKVASGLDDWSKSEVGLEAKLKQLNTTLDAQKKKADLARKELEETKKVYGENAAETDRAREKLNRYEAAVNSTEKELDHYESELKDCKEQTGKFADETDDLEDATQKASDGFTVMKGALASLVADGFRLAISAAKDFAKETLTVGMNFEQGMAQVSAVSGATGDELDALTAKAKEMGAKTKFSATESAEAFNYMAMAGWETEDMINGIEGVMSLAAASGEDLATTSDIVTDALTAMGYAAGDSGHLADVMAAASSNANTNVGLMGKTFQYAAPIVGALGYSMEDTAVAIGLMANAGIKGDKAGTALRAVLTRLSAPPKDCAEALDHLGISLKDSEGNMKSLDEVMADLRSRFSTFNETQKTAYAKAIAGQNAMSGLLAIVNAAPEDYAKLTDAVRESEGAAASMADTMNDTVEGQLTLLKSQIEGVQIQIYERLVPYLKKGVDTISESISAIDWDVVGDKLGNFASKAIDLFVKIVENADGIVDILKAIGISLGTAFVISKVLAFAGTISTLFKTFQALKTATDVATSSQLLLNAAQAATPIGMVVAGVAALGAGLVYLASKNKEAAESTQVLTDFEEEQINKINDMKAAYDEMNAARNESIKSIESEYGYYQELKDELDTLVDANGNVKAGYEDRVDFILNTLNQACGTEMALIDGVIENYNEERDSLEKLIEAKKAEAVLRASEESYTAAIQNRQDALQNLTTAQGIYKQNVSDMNAAEKAYNDMLSMTTEEYAKLNNLEYDMGAASQQLKNDQEELKQKFIESKAAVGESRVAMGNAQKTYDGYMTTIQNYEGLSAAIISGDASKIATALTDMEYNFQTAETSTKESLERQVENYEANLASLEEAIRSGTPGVTQEMVDQAEAMVKAAKEELDKAPDDFADTLGKAGEKGAKAIGSDANKKTATASGKAIRDSATGGMAPDGTETTAGNNLVDGYINAMKGRYGDVNTAGQGLSKSGVSGVNEGQESNSPSKATYRSGEYFGQGFINGMESKKNDIWNKAVSLAKKAIEGLKAGQKEGSPSKITFQSGVYFTQGYINGIVSMQGKLNATVKSMVKTVTSELLKMSNFDFSAVAESASEAYSNALTKKFDYTMNRASYENDQKIKEFDKTISDYETNQKKDSAKLQSTSNKKIKTIEKKRDKTVNSLQKKLDALDSKKENAAERKKLQNKIKAAKAKATKQINAEKAATKKQIENSDKGYEKLINAEKKKQEAYKEASSAFLSAYSDAMQEYQSKAQKLIDDTIGGITDKYNERYDELIGKQNNLIEKLKSAGDLFNISGAGVMTINDIQEQTRQIREYTEKLRRIKEKVSSELFDEIVSYDMKEGSAFMERLLAMSADELDAYNKAYTEKMEAAQEAGESIYKADFEQLSKDYKNDINKAFKDIDKQLTELGKQAMQGFVNGLTSDTDYLSKNVQTYIKSMLSTFEKELKISSPSKVTYKLGDFTGEGFVNGFKNTINEAKKTAMEMAQSMATPLDDVVNNIGNMKASVNGAGSSTSQTTVVNNYYFTQNNTSPKSLSALETFQAERQMISMMKAMT